ncbi:MAG: isoprenylcysteine carboxylmethyltransferase family protein [Acidobacteriota bacterium]
MTASLEFLPTMVFTVVMLSWFAFVVVFVARKNPPPPPDSKRDRISILGIALQGISYAVVWSVHRPFFTPIVRMRKEIEILVAIVTMVVAVGSVWFVSSAVRSLGKHWSIAARLVEGHKLVTEGPYRVVRNPIYTGMFGMLLATGMAIGHWIGLLIAIVVFAVGTVIRVQSEERLLREAFGAEFEAYSRRVPAVVPFLF